MMSNQNRRTQRTTKKKRRTHAPFPGRLVVIGGQCRKVGKTALAVDLIRAYPEFQWTAVKFTPYAESGCPVKGAKCGCDPGEHTFAIRTEKSHKGTTDTSRFLAAGAKRAIWVQTKSGRMEDALAPLLSAIGGAENVIIESNAILKFWDAELFLLVLDPRNAEFKGSAQKVLRLADAFVFRSPFLRGARPKGALIPNSGKPKFLHPLGGELPADMQRFIRQRFLKFDHHKGKQ